MLKKESNNLRKAVDDTPTIVNDFRLRPLFWSYRNVDYIIPDWYSSLKPILEAYLSELAKKGALDEGNGDVLDPLIEDLTKEARAELRRQRENHKDLNEDFEIRKEGDRLAVSKHLKLCEAERDRTRDTEQIVFNLLELYEGRKENSDEYQE